MTSAQYLLDSESSKSSDFKRMNNQSNDDVTVKDVSAWTEAKVNSLMANHRMVNVTHGAIPEWDWPEMTMDFIVTESVDFSRIKEGMNLQIEIQKVAGGNVEVVNVRLPDAETPAPMDHSQHQMPAEPSSSHVNN